MGDLPFGRHPMRPKDSKVATYASSLPNSQKSGQS